MKFFTAAVLLLALTASVRVFGAADDERTFNLYPRKVTTTAVTDTTWSVVFGSPLTLKTYTWEAFCVGFGNECTAPNVGTGATAIYGPTLNNATVTGLTPNTTYSCYVATILPRNTGAVCSAPTYVYTNITI